MSFPETVAGAQVIRVSASHTGPLRAGRSEGPQSVHPVPAAVVFTSQAGWPSWIPRPLVARYTWPWTRGSPVMAWPIQPH